MQFFVEELEEGIIGHWIFNCLVFVSWIVFRIGSCLVMVIFSIYSMARIKNLLVAGISIPWFGFQVRIKKHLHSRLTDFLLSLRCKEVHSRKIGISQTNYSAWASGRDRYGIYLNLSMISKWNSYWIWIIWVCLFEFGSYIHCFTWI